MSNTTIATTIDHLNGQQIQRLLAPIIFLCLMLVVGIPGNTAVLLIYGRRYTRSVHRTIIINLAIVDQLFCTVGIPFNIARIVHFYSFKGEWACIIFVVLLYFMLLYSTHLLMLMSFHRLRKICFPFAAQLTTRNVRYWVLCCFGIALVLSLPFFGLSKYEEITVGENLTAHSCAISLSNPSTFSIAFSYGFLALFIMYTIILVIIYTIIGRKVYVQHTSRNRKSSKGSNTAISSKMTKIAFSISIVFALSYIPLFILQITKQFVEDKELSPFQFALWRIGERLYVINHVANPFVYGIFDKEFKKHLSEIIHCRYHYDEEQETSQSAASTGL